MDGVLAAAYLPTDGHVDPTSLTNALAKGATDRGATIVRHAPVTGLVRERRRLDGDDGEGRDPRRARRARGRPVDAPGRAARRRRAADRAARAPLPRHRADRRGRGAAPVELPVFRDPDNSFYARQEGDGLLVGPFEQDPKAWALDGVPDDFHGRLLPPDLDQIEDCLESPRPSGSRCSARPGSKTAINGPDGYTPDGRCLMGPVPGQRGLHVLAGFSIFGIVFGGGAGQVRGRVDRRGPAERQHVGARRPPLRRLRPLHLLRRRARVRGVRGRVQDPLPRGGATRRAGRSRPTRCTTEAAREGRRDGRRAPAGSGRSGSRAPGERGARRTTASAAATGSTRSGASAAPCARRVGVLDQTSFAKYDVLGPGRDRVPRPRSAPTACRPSRAGWR